mmetsp:Transcript_1896/g.7165  ORF Transcript_1896/g.7165 Transcript_1896/m.7165 type:complete len:160 (-) Transcript_1896:2792-3271(-)
MRSYRGRMGFIASGWLGRSGLGRKLSTRRRQLDFEGFREPELEGLPDSELARLRYFRQAHSRKFEAHVMSMSLPHTRTETEPIDIEDLPPKRKKLRRGVQVEVDITELASTGEGRLQILLTAQGPESWEASNLIKDSECLFSLLTFRGSKTRHWNGYIC